MLTALQRRVPAPAVPAMWQGVKELNLAGSAQNAARPPGQPPIRNWCPRPGIEPATCRLQDGCSPTELQGRWGGLRGSNPPWRGHNAPCSPVHQDHHRLPGVGRRQIAVPVRLYPAPCQACAGPYGEAPRNRTPSCRVATCRPDHLARASSGTGGRDRTPADAVLETAALPLSYTGKYSPF